MDPKRAPGGEASAGVAPSVAEAAAGGGEKGGGPPSGRRGIVDAAGRLGLHPVFVQQGEPEPVGVAERRPRAKKRSVVDKKESDFGEVGRFTAHKAGGHYSSKSKSLLEITRAKEIEIQKIRDIAEEKAKILLAGGKLE